jgi:hypothetical protein
MTAKIIVLDDWVEAITKVWIDNYRGAPCWSSRYRGPALGGVNDAICETRIDSHNSRCGGFSRIVTRNMEDGDSHSIEYLSKYDVSCPSGEIDPDLKAYGHSEYVANLLFRVEGIDCDLFFSGNVYEYFSESTRIRTRMRFDDLTNEEVLISIGRFESSDRNINLKDSHLYRLKICTRMHGYHDPTEIVYKFRFNRVELTISDKSMICWPTDICQILSDLSEPPIPPKLAVD